MDFSLAEKQHLLVESARTFARHELASKAADWGRNHHFPVGVTRVIAEQGYLGLYIVGEDGGLDLSRPSTSLIFEQLTAGCVAAAVYISIRNMTVWVLASFGDMALKEAWLPGPTGDKSLASYCLTKPDAGSGATRLHARARREGDEYILDNNRCFISGTGGIQVLTVMVHTSEDGARGVSYFLVPADTPNIHYGRSENEMNWHAQSAHTIALEDVRIPASDHIGLGGQGLIYAMRGPGGGRLNVAGCSLGTAQATLEQSVHYVEERKQFGRPLATF